MQLCCFLKTVTYVMLVLSYNFSKVSIYTDKFISCRIAFKIPPASPFSCFFPSVCLLVSFFSFLSSFSPSFFFIRAIFFFWLLYNITLNYRQSFQHYLIKSVLLLNLFKLKKIHFESYYITSGDSMYYLIKIMYIKTLTGKCFFSWIPPPCVAWQSSRPASSSISEVPHAFVFTNLLPRSGQPLIF